METPRVNGWNEWSKFVLGNLQRVEEKIESLQQKIDDKIRTGEQKIMELHFEITTLRVELAKLQVKSSLWGAVAGALTIAIIMGLSYLRG